MDRPSRSRIIAIGECYFVELESQSAIDMGIIIYCIAVTTDEEVSYWVCYNSISVDEEIVDEYYSACHLTDDFHLVPALLVSRSCDILPPIIERSNLGMYSRLSIINGSHLQVK